MWLVTSAGRDAWKAQDTAIPERYRRLLRSIDVQGDTRAIQELLGQYPRHLVEDWLHELEELGFIESRASSVEVSKVAAEAAAALADTGAYLVSRSAKPRNPKPAAETTILIVEDDPDQLALADLRVSAAGYKVRAAGSAAELARYLAGDEVPDLVLLDVMLPDGNGFDVLSGLRRQARFASLPIIMLTVVSDPAHIGQGLALGADGYVTKPYSKNILIGVIKGVLGDPS
jgi:CheY-like chemotaxis protein